MDWPEPDEGWAAAASGAGAGGRLQRARLMDEPSMRGQNSRQMHSGTRVDVEEEVGTRPPACRAHWAGEGITLIRAMSRISSCELRARRLTHVIVDTY